MKRILQTLLFALMAIMMPIGVLAQTSTIDLSTLTGTYVVNDNEEYIFTGTGSYGIKVESGNPRIVLHQRMLLNNRHLRGIRNRSSFQSYTHRPVWARRVASLQSLPS